VQRLFGRCFLIVGIGPAQRDDLVIPIVVLRYAAAPPFACRPRFPVAWSTPLHDP
jgi:hypothetical protein